jgi:uncharacterized protein (TIGR03067 family)
LACPLRGFAPISLFAQGFVTRYSELLAVWIAIAPDSTNGDFQCKSIQIKAMPVLAIGIVAAITASCANSKLGGATAQSAAAQRDYERLSGTWQLTRAVVNGKPVPASVLRNTILITDRNTFRFPKASGVGTHPAGSFTVNPDTKPKQVDSIAEGGPNAGHLTRGIYEILDANHKRACWGPPGGPRPTEFKSPPGSRRILQYWTKIGPVPSH